MNKIKSKCDYCKYHTGRGCMVTPNSYYCKEANDEYYQSIRSKKQQPLQKSLRSWDKNKLN